jgi:hypothetical protein
LSLERRHGQVNQPAPGSGGLRDQLKSPPSPPDCITDFPLLPPEVLEPCRRQFGVPNRVLNASMAEPVLDGSRIVPGVR